MTVSFIDIKTHNKLMRKDAINAFAKVFDKGDFILGEEVKLFENDFAGYCGARFAVGVNSGTDALFLGLLSLGIKPSDEVICPVYTYIATALSISYCGAKPVFVDIDKRTFNIDLEDVKRKITKRTKAIIAVHLYGNPAPMPEIMRIAKKYKLKVIEDAAQSHGAQIRIKGNKWQAVGTFGDIGCFSFYPTKNLSGCGDAGLIISNSKGIYERLLMLRDQGRRGSDRYIHYIQGYNSRLDTLQAAILRQKLKYLNKWNAVRQCMAGIYSKQLKDVQDIAVPYQENNYKHVFHLYPILAMNRDFLHKELKSYNIPTGIVYHKPLHLQPAYKDLLHKRGDFPASEYVSRHILCLPMHPALTAKQVKSVTECVKK
ncbi:MAG: DegT/DnrJ/EryC1/StrS family aminotransferase, partial [Candidatus Omnitrophica bacterium]|nr:DegT/DnrJ/EryC1/StrS family aminotransferase [Candidatus Omnitrophota bacterium]